MREQARLPLFPSPTAVFSGLLDDGARSAALRWLLAERERHPGLCRSNVGGWHSLPDLIQRTVPALQPVWQAAAEATTAHHGALMAPGADRSRLQLRLQAWAMIMERGHYTMPHDHQDATWSGVYYLDAGDAPPSQPMSGRLTLCSPLGGRGGVAALPELQSTFTITPADDHLVLFPGWLQHYVHPYQGSRPRVAIAFNALVRAG